MNFTIEKLPVFCLENKNVIKIKDPFVLGIYTFIKMEIEHQGITVEEIINKIYSHFTIEKEKIVETLNLLVEELNLIKMKYNE